MKTLNTLGALTITAGVAFCSVDLQFNAESTSLQPVETTMSAVADEERSSTAARPGCVSGTELDRVGHGTARQEVHETFGTVGRVVTEEVNGYVADGPDGSASVLRYRQVRVYRGCAGATGVLAGFVKRSVNGAEGVYRLKRITSLALPR